MGKFLDSFDERLKITDKKNYYREQYQSFMTGPEWRNVEMAEEYAQFIKEGHSIFQYPYFRQILDLWGVLFSSFAHARKYNSVLEIINSEYMVMDLFVCLFTTLELAPKGFLSLLIAPFLNKENKTPMQQHFASLYKKYSEDVQTIPFFDHNYDEMYRNLAAKYNSTSEKTWGDWLSWQCIATELVFRKWVSRPLSYWFHQEENSSPVTTDILIKYRADEGLSKDDALEQFKEKIKHLGSAETVSLIGDIYIKAPSEQKAYSSFYARLRVPRYAAFCEVVSACARERIELRKIAGQGQVQVKCDVQATNPVELDKVLDKLTEKAHHKPIYYYSDRIHPNRRICLFDVPVRSLVQQHDEFKQTENTTVSLIHNF